MIRLLSIVLFAALCSAHAAIAASPPPHKQEPLRVCPQEWIVNRMPMVLPEGKAAPRREYFILNGQRRELREFDLRWLRANCLLRPQTVW